MLDSGSQVTILYRSFYDTYLKHLPLQPLENLEICSLSSYRYPYEGYLTIQLEFTASVTGVPQKVNTLALVCPYPVKDDNIAVLVGTNTQLIRKLIMSCKEQAGEHFLGVLTIHPILREAYAKVSQPEIPEEVDKHGTVWFAQPKPITLQPGQASKVSGLPKYPRNFQDQLALVDQSTDTFSSGELWVKPEAHPASVVSSKCIIVTVKNLSTREICLKCGTQLAHIFPVTPVASRAPRVD